ncbi:hypothetical protein ACLGGT_10430 [Roseovarius sp. MS2]|uniref:hypothetical protein n=1 Tax=Roseovarius sp. MS2 TaxID=3390728 RepID=UPI003EDCA6C6
MTDNQRHLKDIETFLTAIAGRILQVSDRKASVAVGAATSTAVGSAVATSVMGAVGAYGTASTTAAIAGLTGAAKTSATLYWIGGLVGGGVAAGGVVLGAGALGAGIYGSVKLRRAILGRSRQDNLSEREQAIVLAIHALTQSIRETIDNGATVADKELILFTRIGVTPLIEEVQHVLDSGQLAGMKIYNRARLRGHLINLQTLLTKLDPK